MRPIYGYVFKNVTVTKKSKNGEDIDISHTSYIETQMQSLCFYTEEHLKEYVADLLQGRFENNGVPRYVCNDSDVISVVSAGGMFDLDDPYTKFIAPLSYFGDTEED